MNTPCREWRERWIAVASQDAPLETTLTAHLATCSACSMFLTRLRLHVRTLSRLTAMPAPRELDGLVVAATQAGARQDRAVEALTNLTRRPMPNEVQPTFTVKKVQAAPRDLDRLVVSELADPKLAIARRLVGRLERQRVPDELAARLADVSTPLPSDRRRAEDRRRAFAFAGSLFLVLAGLVGILSLFRSGEVEARSPRIVIEHVASPENMDAAVQATFAMLSGGAVDAQRAAQEKL